MATMEGNPDRVWIQVTVKHLGEMYRELARLKAENAMLTGLVNKHVEGLARAES